MVSRFFFVLWESKIKMIDYKKKLFFDFMTAHVDKAAYEEDLGVSLNSSPQCQAKCL